MHADQMRMVADLFVKLAMIAELGESRSRGTAKSGCRKGRHQQAHDRSHVEEGPQKTRRQNTKRKNASAVSLSGDDPRPIIKNQKLDAPWLPMMATLNEILDVPTTRPEVRDIEGFVTQANRIEFPATHAFKCGNDEKEKDTSSGGLPVPQQWGLRRKSERASCRNDRTIHRFRR